MVVRFRENKRNIQRVIEEIISLFPAKSLRNIENFNGLIKLSARMHQNRPIFIRSIR